MGIRNELISNEKIVKLTNITNFLPVNYNDIKSFHCGWSNSFFVTSIKKWLKYVLFKIDNGEVYSTGSNIFGQLGNSFNSENKSNFS